MSNMDRAAKHKGMSAFMVDMHAPGVTQKAIETKLGLFCAPTGKSISRQCEVAQRQLDRKERRWVQALHVHARQHPALLFRGGCKGGEGVP